MCCARGQRADADRGRFAGRELEDGRAGRPVLQRAARDQETPARRGNRGIPDRERQPCDDSRSDPGSVGHDRVEPPCPCVPAHHVGGTADRGRRRVRARRRQPPHDRGVPGRRVDPDDLVELRDTVAAAEHVGVAPDGRRARVVTRRRKMTHDPSAGGVELDDLIRGRVGRREPAEEQRLPADDGTRWILKWRRQPACGVFDEDRSPEDAQHPRPWPGAAPNPRVCRGRVAAVLRAARHEDDRRRRDRNDRERQPTDPPRPLAALSAATPGAPIHRGQHAHLVGPFDHTGRSAVVPVVVVEARVSPGPSLWKRREANP